MIELLSLAIGVGLVVSLLFGEIFGLTAGGMIVPGYVAVYMMQPWSIALTLGAALVTHSVVRSISSVAIVYGRRRTVLTILVGYLAGVGARFAVGQDLLPGEEIALIGFIIPGLIAIWFERQGIIETLTALITGSVIVRLILILLVLE